MIAKEIRQVVRMTSANMDPAMMFRQRYGIEVCKCYRVALKVIFFIYWPSAFYCALTVLSAL